MQFWRIRWYWLVGLAAVLAPPRCNDLVNNALASGQLQGRLANLVLLALGAVPACGLAWLAWVCPLLATRSVPPGSTEARLRRRLCWLPWLAWVPAVLLGLFVAAPLYSAVADGLAGGPWRLYSEDTRSSLYALPLLLGSIALAWWVRRVVRHRGVALLAGLQVRCGNCGYDLRASTGSCPECGVPIPQAALTAP